MSSITPQAYIQDPYPFFAEQRRRRPVTRIEFFSGPVWLVTGYDEAEAIMKDDRFLRDGRALSGADERAAMPDNVRQAMAMKNQMILVRDAPFHTRVRKLLSRVFSPVMVRRLQADMEAISGQLLREMRERRQHELIADYAYKFPMYVISDLIGVPAKDRHYSQQWSEAFVQFIDFHRTPEELSLAADVMLHARDYFRDLIGLRRRQPRMDLISELTARQLSDGQISEDEIVATCVLLLSAGHETTVNLIANGYYLLLRHPHQLARLRSDRSLLPNAIEEILRFEPPALTSSRWVSRDMEVYGQPFRKGDFVIIALGGANRDPRSMAEPDRFLIDRSPVKHLSFASGAHYCLGAYLARQEGRIALDMLVESLVDPVLLEEPRWKNSIALRGFEALRVQADIAEPSIRLEGKSS